MARKSGRSSGSTLEGRRLATRVKTARGRKASSTRWLQRQLNDPYVAEAKARGYRSRAAFKLLEIDDRFGLLKSGVKVLDLGAAPGGWSQVAVARCGKDNVVAVDVNAFEAIPGVVCLQLDIYDEDAVDRLRAALPEGADVVLSDMAPPATGHPATDHMRIMALAEAAYDVAEGLIRPGGVIVAKVLQGGTEAQLLNRLKQHFQTVKHMKPPASRKDSREIYVVATGFRRIK